ncbi:hypothetical protein BAE46_09275 [Glaciecola punicea]|uniref:peptidylprolyl isomerase n=1 Tax=Glaciecola punicea TaxID=56804 RepID=UPI000893ABA3|nr:peptidyl-prolyl cis-trans isomerase [Glaciecola punicea]OFA31149.1 hypothetical protein BAE46_09275 [Glaciecola punicea]
MSQPVTSFKTLSRTLMCALGLSLVLVGSTRYINWPFLPAGTLLTVNQVSISVEALQAVLERSTGLSLENLSDSQYQGLIQRLIDDELIIQRAEELDIPTEDPGISKLLIRAVVDNIVNDFLSSPVDEEDLIAFYANNKPVFQQTSRIKLVVAQFGMAKTAASARTAILTGESFIDVVARFKQASIVNMPAASLPEHMIRRYLSSTIADLALKLAPNEISQPILYQDLYYIVQVLNISPAALPPYHIIRKAVESEFYSRGRQQALDTALQDMRQEASIVVNQKLLEDLGIPKDAKW